MYLFFLPGCAQLSVVLVLTESICLFLAHIISLREKTVPACNRLFVLRLKKTIVLNDTSQTQKYKYCMSSLKSKF